ncbi:DUF2744 domain-containing protein [Rhodococcus jostii]|uniref:phage gene 29 protein family protein n=1 Tax=Rhodococcus jostii TaxID=132919 RepID=UPI0036302F68
MARLSTLEEYAYSDDPELRNQFVCVALPFHGQTPYTVEDELLPQWSKRLDEVGYVWAPRLAELADENGFIHVSQLPVPTIKFRPPFRGQQNSLNNSGVWVDVNDPDPDPVVLPDVTTYTRHEQEVIAAQLRQEGVIHQEKTQVDVAEVLPKRLFDPAEHSPSTVNGYLMGVADVERRRVVAAEMTGKGRDQILRKWRGV